MKSRKPKYNCPCRDCPDLVKKPHECDGGCEFSYPVAVVDEDTCRGCGVKRYCHDFKMWDIGRKALDRSK